MCSIMKTKAVTFAIEIFRYEKGIWCCFLHIFICFHFDFTHHKYDLSLQMNNNSMLPNGTSSKSL